MVGTTTIYNKFRKLHYKKLVLQLRLVLLYIFVGIVIYFNKKYTLLQLIGQLMTLTFFLFFPPPRYRLL